MRFFTRRGLALAACLAAVSVTHAAANPDPAQSNAAVPATQYQSAFQNYAPVQESSTTPDKEWRAANAALAAEPGDGDMPGMNMGAMNTDGAMKMPTEKPPGMKMQTDMPMPMNGKDAAPPMGMHHHHGQEK
jgi:hypothetical protein